MGRPYVVQSGPIRGAKGDPGPQGPPGSAIAVGFYSPRDHGAHPGNSALDSGPGIQAAIQAAKDAGGGIVLIDDAYYCSGVITQLGGVSVIGIGPRRGSTTPPDPDRGLFALDSTFEYHYGKWTAGSADDNPGPIWNVLIDGQSIAGASQLFLMECVNGSIRDCQIINSVGDGLEVGASQNSYVEGGFIGLCPAGAAISVVPYDDRQGAGMVTFSNLYVATSRYLLIGDTSPTNFAPHQVAFNSVLFENYIAGNDVAWLKAGEYQFRGCDFTNSAAGGVLSGVTGNDCIVLITNDTKPSESTHATFDSCYFASSGGTLSDLIRVKNSASDGSQVANYLNIYGRTHYSKANNIFCVDGGGLYSAVVSALGETVKITGTLNRFRYINGGAAYSVRADQRAPTRISVTDDATGTQLAALDLRVDGESAKRIIADVIHDAGDGLRKSPGIFMYDGTDGATIRASWYWDNVNDLSVLGRIVQIANGISLRSVQTSITTAGQAVTLSGSNTSSPKKVLNFTADSATATVTMSGGTGGSLLLVEIHNNGHSGTSITWPSNVHFARASAQPSGSGVQSVLFSNYAGTDWYEVGPGTPSTSGDVTGPSSSTSGNIVTMSGTSGKVIQDSGKSHSTDGTLAGNSDSLIPTQKATKTYVDAAVATSATLVGDRLTTGQETFDRIGIVSNTIAMTSGVVKLTYFTARKTETVTTLRTYAGAVAAGATPTICRMGLYSIDGSGNLTLIASTPNDTSLWSAINTQYAKALSASVGVVAGTRYAFGSICVTAATVPQVAGGLPNLMMSDVAPRISAQLTGQTDLPSSITSASLNRLAQRVYGELIP